MEDINREIVDGANPSIIWTQYMDFLSTYSAQMKRKYTKRMRENNPFTWAELDVMNKELHDKLDYLMTWKDDIQTENRKRNVVRLTESQLKQIVAESVKRILTEGKYYNSKRKLTESGHIYFKDDEGNIHTNSRQTYRGVPGSIFISHGEWADPEIIWDGQSINASAFEDELWVIYKDYCDEKKINPNDIEFEEWLQEQGTRFIADELSSYLYISNGGSY